VTEFPAVTVAPDGVAETEKSARKIARATVALWPAEVPVTVKFKGLAVVDERLFTVRVLDCPARIELGLKLQVAPEVQERAMLLVNELGAEAVMLNVVEVVPMRTTFDRLLAERENSGVPVPVSVTPAAPFAALDRTVTLPERLPLPLGVKVTEIVQA
jgi:hypothetical protein